MTNKQDQPVDNLAIWNEVEATPPSKTKTGDFQGRVLTSINPTYLVKRATEMFGMMGCGWGCEIIEERFDDGKPMHNADGGHIGNEIMHTIRLRLWYKVDGERYEVEQFGHTPYVYNTKYGFKTDFEAAKKSYTDAMKKCLSLLGFSADIFMGQYDNPDYIEAQIQSEKIEQADNREDELARQKVEFIEWLEKELQAIKDIPNKSALAVIDRKIRSKAERKAQVLGIKFDSVAKKITDAVNERKQQILPKVVCESCGDITNDEIGNVCRECGGKKVKMEQ